MYINEHTPCFSKPGSLAFDQSSIAAIMASHSDDRVGLYLLRSFLLLCYFKVRNYTNLQELTSAEYRSFRDNFADLFEGIQEPISLSARLFSAGLLHIETKRTICSLERPAQQRNELLDAVERQIRVDPQNFYRFVDELEKDSPMQHLCSKLRSTCGECDNVCLSTSTDQWCSGVAPSAIRMRQTQVPPFSSSSSISCKNKTTKSHIPRLVTPVTIRSTPNTSHW